jgi:mono/diheme cytochrome c family protein
MTAGQTYYGENCASCHGQEGEGVGDFPGLAANSDLTGADVAALVQGYFEVGAHPKDITPEQLAGVLTFARGSFGNTAQAICPADIQVPAAQ